MQLELTSRKLYHISDNILDDHFVIDNNYNSKIYDNLVEREQILENVRKLYFNNYISRLHALFLCDEESVRYWSRVLDEKSIYLVEVNGIAFVSYERYIPKDYDINMAIKYWNNNIVSGNDKEYLFQGDVKVLKKLR